VASCCAKIYGDFAVSRIVVVQISDLHIGSGVIGTKGYYAGYDGHEIVYCELLEGSLPTVRSKCSLSETEPLHFAVVGDLTRTGGGNDFYIAFEFLLERLQRLARVSSSSYVGTLTGLSIPAASMLTVPGNHDHWDGYEGFWARPPAYNQYAFPAYFEKPPWRQTTIWSSDGKLGLDLFGVDSNVGLKGKSANRSARGKLSDEELKGEYDANGVLVRDGLEQLLDQSRNEENQDPQHRPRLRGILCHHAFTKGKQHSLFYARPLTAYWRGRLLDTAHPFGVATIFTGHTHDFESKDYVDPLSGNVIYEMRSASAIQMGKQPEPNGFWAHELTLDQSGAAKWEAHKFQLGKKSASFDYVQSVPVR
jgi:hypothetical protein